MSQLFFTYFLTLSFPFFISSLPSFFPSLTILTLPFLTPPTPFSNPHIHFSLLFLSCSLLCEKVELALKSLSITKNSSKHKEANIEWLENELHQAEYYIIDQVWECINECKVEISSFYFTEEFVSKKISKSQNSAYEKSYDDDWRWTYSLILRSYNNII
ncbi:hypothetical protein RhiirA5_408141 [Rhizophagus irregularis]|nr:hypothetical protein RhiirA5_408141 [Rhizophagus irregularis]PKY14031.1 hypothetical protein RhiirB3_425946 [Rhizophagus irregularis]CAB5376083.1 unnamed protein product [Rhizophagus irregularis]